MTHEQIIWQIGIGLFLIVLGAVLVPLFKSAWAWMNRPTPLSSKDKGKLLEQITIQEHPLERLDESTFGVGMKRKTALSFIFTDGLVGRVPRFR